MIKGNHMQCIQQKRVDYYDLDYVIQYNAFHIIFLKTMVKRKCT